MTIYILRRLAYAILILLGVSFITYLLLYLIAYSGEREHPYRLNVNAIFLNASPTGVCTPGVHVQSIS